MGVSTIVHASDLHFGAPRAETEAIHEALVTSLAAESESRGRATDLIVVTGDVFDCAELPVGPAVRGAAALLRRMRDALVGAPPIVIVPGNHDRRAGGLVGPQRYELFSALAEELAGEAFVHGGHESYLMAVVPRVFHRQPLSLLAYDSTHLARGLLSAGGLMRPEDFLFAASRVSEDPPDWPIVVLQHHHLLPTPLADFDPIRTNGGSSLVRWGISELLPRLVAHADREEWMMAALGAGTALSVLHSLGRPVVVLHGHKHYATARMLSATELGQGDVVTISAGSAGIAEPAGMREGSTRSPRRWPSFNVIELGRDSLSVERIAFGFSGLSFGNLASRPLLWARRREARFDIVPVTPTPPEECAPRLALNEAHFCLLKASRQGLGRYDVELRRYLEPKEGASIPHYFEEVGGPPGATVVIYDPPTGMGAEHRAPVPLELPPALKSKYVIRGGAYRSLLDRQRTEGPDASPFGAVRMVNRYHSDRAVVRLAGLDGLAADAFASATDLGTGLERPVPLEHEPNGVVRLEYIDCPARTLLTIRWPLARERWPLAAGPHHRSAGEGPSVVSAGFDRLNSVKL